jgi:phosphatidylserine decarboxylase
MSQGSHSEGSAGAQRWPMVAREGWPIVAGFAVVGLALAMAAQWIFGSAGALPVSVVALALTGWCLWFFRDPERQGPSDPAALVSPADGVVCFVGRAAPPAELQIAPERAATLTRVSGTG